MGEESSSQYWDNLWAERDNSRAFNSFVNKWSKKYLNAGQKVVDGGCGNGSIVHTLQESNYDAYGFDYAQQTVERLNSKRPDLKISLGDVRESSFEDSYFDGYWSLGVIEHFTEGYELIASDMQRIIKVGGYLFLTVPIFSPLRRLKASLGIFPKLEKIDENKFYQFALSPKEIKEVYSKVGFELVETKGFDSFKELKDELTILKPILQKVYDSNNILCRVLKKTINTFCTAFLHHSRIFVFKRIS